MHRDTTPGGVSTGPRSCLADARLREVRPAEARRPGSRPRSRLLALAALVLASAATACDDFFSEPTIEAPTTLQIVPRYSQQVGAGTVADAFDVVDRLRVTLLDPANVEEPVVDTVVTPRSTPEGLSARVAIPGGTEGLYLVASELRRGTDALFQGAGEAVIVPGRAASATLDLVPVPTDVVIQFPAIDLAAVGDTFTATGVSTMATGDTIGEFPFRWQSLDPTVVSVDPEGWLIGKTVGTTQVVAFASLPGLPPVSDTTTVSVLGPFPGTPALCPASTVSTLLELRALAGENCGDIDGPLTINVPELVELDYFPVLTSIAGPLTIRDNPRLQDASIPSLAEVSDGILIERNDSVRTARFPNLTQVAQLVATGPALQVNDNPFLVAFQAPQLVQAGGDLIQFNRNPVLATLDVSTLDLFEGTLDFQDNPVLCAGDLVALAQRLGVAPQNFINSGNDDTCNPQPPPAGGDTIFFDAVGNTPLVGGNATPPAIPHVLDPRGLLDGLQGETVVPGSGATSGDGTFTALSDGTFNYQPLRGSIDPDTFSIQLGSGATRTVVVNFDEAIWYVNGALQAGEGTAANPFPTVAEAQAALGGGAGKIWVAQGNSATTPYGPVVLAAGQEIWGEGAELLADLGGTPTAIWPAQGDPVFSNPNGAGVEMGSGTRLRGVSVLNAATGVSSALESDVTLELVTIQNVETAGVELLNTGGSITLTEVDVSGIPFGGNGIRLVGGDPNVVHTGTIVAEDGVGIFILAEQPTSRFDFLGQYVSGPAADGTAVSADTPGTFYVEDVVMTGGGSGVSLGGNGVFTVNQIGGGDAGLGNGIVYNGGSGTVTVTVAPGGMQTNSGVQIFGLELGGVVSVDGGPISSSGSDVAFLDGVNGDVTIANDLDAVDFGTTGISVSLGSGNVAFDGGVVLAGDVASVGLSVDSHFGALAFQNLFISGADVRAIDLVGGILDGFIGVEVDNQDLQDPGPVVRIEGHTGAVDFYSLRIAQAGVGEAFRMVDAGEVNVSDPAAVLTSQFSPALLLDNLALGVNGFALESMSSFGGDRGAFVRNTFGVGRLVISGTGTPGSGGTLSNHTVGGMELENTAVQISDMDMTNQQGNLAALWGVTLAPSTIDGVRITDANRGIYLADIRSGAFISISDPIVTGANDGITVIQEQGASAGFITISGAEVIDSQGLAMAFLTRGAAGLRVNLNLPNQTSTSGFGISAQQVGTGNLDLDVNGGSFDRPVAMLGLGAGRLRFDVSDASLQTNDGAALRVDNQVAGSLIEGWLRNSTVGSSSPILTTRGMEVVAAANTDVVVGMEDNVITDVATPFTYVSGPADAGQASVTLLSNQLEANPGFDQSAITLEVSGTRGLCANIQGNTTSAASSDMSLIQVTPAGFQLVDRGLGVDDPAATLTAPALNNTVTSGIFWTGEFSPATGCTAPSQL